MPDPEDVFYEPEIESQIRKFVDGEVQCEHSEEQFERHSDGEVAINYSTKEKGEIGSKDTLNFQPPSTPFGSQFQFESGQEIREMLSGK